MTIPDLVAVRLGVCDSSTAILLTAKSVKLISKNEHNLLNMFKKKLKYEFKSKSRPMLGKKMSHSKMISRK